MPIGLPDIRQAIKLDYRSVITGGQKVQQSFKAIGNEATKQVAKTSAVIAALQARIDELGDEAAEARRKIARLNRELTELRAKSLGAGGRRGGGGPLDRLASAFKRAGNSAGFFASTIKLLKIPAIVLAISELLKIVNALAAGLVALTGALGPLTGVFAALPGLIAPVVQGFGAVLLATRGVSDAFKAYQEAQDAAKDPSFAQAQEQAASSLAEAEADLAAAREYATAASTTGSLFEYQAALQGVQLAEEGVAAARENQAQVTEQANEAQRKYEEQLSKLDPSVGRFVEKIEEIRPQFEGLRRQAQAGLFPGVIDALEQLRVLFDPIGRIVQETTRVFGNFARALAETITRPDWLEDLNLFGSVNAGILERMGGILLDLLDALRHLGAAAVPFVDWIVQLHESFGRWASSAALAGRETGRIAAYLDRTRDVVNSLGRTIWNFGGALRQVFTVGRDLGQDMLDSMEVMTDRFREWTRTAEGQKRINEYFDAARPILHELALLTGDLFRGLGRQMIEGTKQTGNMISLLRTDLLPVLLDVLSSISDAFGPALINLVAEMARAFELLAGRSGPLTVFIKVLTSMFEALNKLMETIPGVRTLVLLLATFSGAVRAFQFAKFISGIGRMGKALSGLIKGFRGVEVATKRGAAGMLTAVGVGERLRGMYQDLAIAAHTYVSRVGLLRAGAVAGGYALIAGALFQVFQEQKRAEAKAKELHEELTKDLDLSTYDDVVEGINRTADAYNSAIDEMLRRGYDSVWMRFRDGFLDLIPGINTGYHDLMAIQGNEGQELEKLQARQRAMNKIYQVTALRLGVTTEEAKLLAEELGIDLEPAIRAVTNGADNAASEIDTVARKTEVAAERAREFTPAMEDMASALESMAEATTATERLRAFSDIIDASISPIIEAEKAQARLDSILGDTTDSLGDYRRETDRVSAEWAERQAEAAKDLQRAQQSLTEANANLAEARKTGTFFEVQSALEAQARAQEQVNAATERQAEVEADAQKALSGVAKTGKKAYETPQEAAWDLVDAVGGVLTQTYATTQSVDAVRERFQDMRGDLVEQLRQFGLTEQQVEHYIDILDQIPDNVEVATQLNGADQESIRTAVQESSDALNRFLQNNPEMRPTILATLGIDEADLQRLLSGKQATVDMPKAEAVRTQNEPVLSALPPSVAMTLADLEGRVAAAQEAFDNIKSDPDNIKSMLPDTYAQMLGEAAKAKTEAEDALVAFLRRWGLRSTYVQAGDIRNRAPMVSDSPILWAEGRAPEAYIPYDPRYRHRATSLLSQVAKDFGLALLPYQHPRRRSFAAGGLIPHMAIRDTATQIRRAADGVITRGATTPSSSTSISHDYGGIYVTTIDKPTGEQLGRDLAWGLMGSQRGTTRRTRT